MKLIWTIERRERAHRLRRMGMYPEEIAPIMNTTTNAINRFLSLEKKRGIIHHKLKPRNLRWDKEVVSEWRSLKRELPDITYDQMAVVFKGPHRITICKKLGMEALGRLEF